MEPANTANQKKKVVGKSPKAKVGIVTDLDMTLHKCKGGHPERPERITQTLDHLKQTGLLAKCAFVDKLTEVDEAYIKTLHSQSYIEYIKDICAKYDDTKASEFTDSFYNQFTYTAARKALRGAKVITDKIMEGEWESGYGLLRPPGHHAAVENKICGFCIFSTVALTAKYAKEKYRLKRILIFDWDVHHGDSTQKFLNEDSNILFISLHRFDKGSFYPGPSGSLENIGKGKGEGYNLNLPWDRDDGALPIAGDSEYIYVFERVLYPIIQKFNPELVFVSAGYDSGRGDPLGGLDLTQDGYAYMLKRLQSVQPRIVVCLEGGYNLNTIAISSEACVRVLLGEEFPLSCSETGLNLKELRDGAAPNKTAFELAAKAIKIFSNYWNVLEAKELIEYEKLILNNAKRHEIFFTDSSRLIRFVEGRVLKSVDAYECSFYEAMQNQESECYKTFINLIKWLPKFYGKEKIRSKEYLSFENYVKDMKDLVAVKITVMPSGTEDYLNATLAGFVVIDKTGTAIKKYRANRAREQQVSFADIANPLELTQGECDSPDYDARDWNEFVANKGAQKNLKGAEEAISCVREIQIALDKESRQDIGAFCVLIIANESGVLHVNIINIEDQKRVENRFKVIENSW